MDGWILVSAPDESSPANECWNGGKWIDISEVHNAQLFLIKQGVKIEDARYRKSERQQKFTDRDVRIAEISVTITLDKILN